MKEPLVLLKESAAMLEGHFLLSSGRHSDRYFQCARLLQYPDRAAEALAEVAGRIRADMEAGKIKIDAVAGPALGGIIVAYELGRQLGLPAFFTERDDTGAMSLRRGFEVQPGQNILISEDVVTTGKSSEETARVLEAAGAKIAALACLVNRLPPGAELSRPLYAACKVDVSDWEAEDCELCKQGIPAVKPGSRKTEPSQSPGSPKAGASGEKIFPHCG
ncbi:MAG: orotate phosphoribosyltransferase [Treponema sp.]|jgi:orotate phosphoribosyltransferase|nr:orotate phosphoribosyltransferase [Treponema sp.]